MAKLKSPAGYVSITDPEGGLIEADTLQCCHCGRHWRVQPGSGKQRGWCMRCNGPVCGPGCAECVPQEQRLENLEQGRPAGHRRIAAPVSGLWLPGR